MKYLKLFFIFPFFAWLFLATLPMPTSMKAFFYAWAGDDHDHAKILLDNQEILALEVILEHARKIQSGTIIEVELEHKKNRLIYEIEILTPQGRVLEMYFNAKTGEYLHSHYEN